MFKYLRLSRVAAMAGLVLLAGLAVTACAPSGPAIVRVTEDEWGLKPSVPSIPAGKVTFQVVNEGKVEHELVILKTDLAVASLKMRPAAPDKVDEETLAKNIGEVEDVGPGETKSETFDLTPGKYVLICNVAGHYQSGMKAAFEVK